MKKIILIMAAVGVVACAKVSVETKEPIKVDISMRIDVYQHVVKDVESIEDQIFGSPEKQLNFLLSIEEAYASDLSPEVEKAIQARKARVSIIEEYFTKAYVGENRNAYLEVMVKNVPPALQKEIGTVIEEENNDRKAVYNYAAEKNKIKLSQAEEIFFKDHLKRAPSGYWFQIYNEEKDEYIWIQK